MIIMEVKKYNPKICSKKNELSGKYCSESTLYEYNGDIIKLLKDNFVNRAPLVYKLGSLDHPDLAIPKYMLYQGKTFKGYGMTYYKDYYVLARMMCDESIPFNKRKEIALKLCKLFEYLESEGFGYYDVHSKNILYKDTDIKLVDLDSGIFDDMDRFEYMVYLKHSQQRLAELSLALLYKEILDTLRDEIIDNKSEILKMVPKNVKELYKHVANQRFSYFRSAEYVDALTEDTVEETKQFLLKKRG